jgi:hypothetical protein
MGIPMSESFMHLHLGIKGEGLVGVCNLNPVYPQLETAWFQPLNLLKYDFMISQFAAFKCNNFVPLQLGPVGAGRASRWGLVQVESSLPIA